MDKEFIENLANRQVFILYNLNKTILEIQVTVGSELRTIGMRLIA